MPDSLTTDRPASHDLYYAAIAAEAEIPPLRSVLERADLRPDLRKKVMTSLADLHERLHEATARFEKENGGEIGEQRFANAMTVFGETITNDDHSFRAWKHCYRECYKLKFGDDGPMPTDETLRAHYSQGRTPMEVLNGCF